MTRPHPSEITDSKHSARNGNTLRLALLDHRLGEILTERGRRDHCLANRIFFLWERLPALRLIRMGGKGTYTLQLTTWLSKLI
jgi:hypothetical protein